MDDAPSSRDASVGPAGNTFPRAHFPKADVAAPRTSFSTKNEDGYGVGSSGSGLGAGADGGLQVISPASDGAL